MHIKLLGKCWGKDEQVEGKAKVSKLRKKWAHFSSCVLDSALSTYTFFTVLQFRFKNSQALLAGPATWANLTLMPQPLKLDNTTSLAPERPAIQERPPAALEPGCCHCLLTHRKLEHGWVRDWLAIPYWVTASGCPRSTGNLNVLKLFLKGQVKQELSHVYMGTD